MLNDGYCYIIPLRGHHQKNVGQTRPQTVDVISCRAQRRSYYAASIHVTKMADTSKRSYINVFAYENSCYVSLIDDRILKAISKKTLLEFKKR